MVSSHACSSFIASLVLWLDSLDWVVDSISVTLLSETAEFSFSFLFSRLSLFKDEFVWILVFTGTVSVVGFSSKIIY